MQTSNEDSRIQESEYRIEQQITHHIRSFFYSCSLLLAPGSYGSAETLHSFI